MRLLRLFRRPDYKSDITLFIEQLKTEQPDLESRQRAARNIWWDKDVDRERLKDARESRVPQKPYVYGNDPTQQ